MLQRKSRYSKAKLLTEQENGFRGVRARDIDIAAGRVEHTITETDRLDLLAEHYYRENRCWWRILDANPGYLYSQDMLPIRQPQAEQQTGIQEKTTEKEQQDSLGEVVLIPARNEE